MLTSRGWWFLLIVLALLGIAAFQGTLTAALLALTLLLWFCWEWLFFAYRARVVVRRLKVLREVRDERGPVDSLWAGRPFQVRLGLELRGWPGLSYVLATERVPQEADLLAGQKQQDGSVNAERPLTWSYRLRCPAAGRIRFEGLAVQLADLQGFFYHATFVRDVVEYRVLPPLADAAGHRPTVKRHNLLPPPGVHRLRRPGSGSELLDLRDYLPGDPPKTIAWKPSARRDRLITKEFESEVPVRCTLLVDASQAVRLGPPGQNALARLVEIAAAVAQASASNRDLVGLGVVDDQTRTFIRPARGRRHIVQLLNVLADAAALSPTTGAAQLSALVPLAHGFAQEVYPELMRPTLNRMPAWLPWLWPQPASSIRRPTWADRVNAWLPVLAVLFVVLADLLLGLLVGFTISVGVSLVEDTPRWTNDRSHSIGTIIMIVAFVIGEIALGSALTFFLLRKLPIFFPGRRRLYHWRKRLAALLSVHYGHAPGGLANLLEDDDRLANLLQRFLAEHHVPCPLPYYDPEGRYLYASPAKVQALAQALLRAIGKGHDNELFVLLVDLLEQSDALEPLLRAVKVALARHHQVLVVCPWPPRVPPPSTGHGPGLPALGAGLPTLPPGTVGIQKDLYEATTVRLHQAFHQLRRTFGRVGVRVLCAQSGDPVPLILERMDRLRARGDDDEPCPQSP